MLVSVTSKSCNRFFTKERTVDATILTAHRPSGNEHHLRARSFTFVSLFSFDVQLCFESDDKLAQNLIIAYTLKADYSSTVGRILSAANYLPNIASEQMINSCNNQTFITKVCQID